MKKKNKQKKNSGSRNIIPDKKSGKRTQLDNQRNAKGKPKKLATPIHRDTKTKRFGYKNLT